MTETLTSARTAWRRGRAGRCPSDTPARIPAPWSRDRRRSEEHTSELQSLMRISYAVFCLKKKKNNKSNTPEKPDQHIHTKQRENHKNNTLKQQPIEIKHKHK